MRFQEGERDAAWAITGGKRGPEAAIDKIQAQQAGVAYAQELQGKAIKRQQESAKLAERQAKAALQLKQKGVDFMIMESNWPLISQTELRGLFLVKPILLLQRRRQIKQRWAGSLIPMLKRPLTSPNLLQGLALSHGIRLL